MIGVGLNMNFLIWAVVKYLDPVEEGKLNV